MKKNQFVTPEIALKLKKLGFDGECFGYFNEKETLKMRYFVDLNWVGFKLKCKNIDKGIEIDKNINKLCLAPLWQQAIDWLETKGYYINITRVFMWNPLPVEFSGWCIFIGTENPEEVLECNSYYVNHFYSTKYEAREQAILKAIELIKEKQQ